MSHVRRAAIAATLMFVLAAALIALAATFKTADDGKLAVATAGSTPPPTVTSAPTVSPSATPANSVSAPTLPPATSAPAGSIGSSIAPSPRTSTTTTGQIDTAQIGNWTAPRIPLLGLRMTPNVSVLSLAGIAGLVGGLIHTLTVLSRRSMRARVVAGSELWYLSTPLTGAAVAVLLFAALVGGLLATGNTTEVANVNLYAVLAIGGTAGLSARKATERLAEWMGDIKPVDPQPPAPAGSPDVKQAAPKPDDQDPGLSASHIGVPSVR